MSRRLALPVLLAALAALLPVQPTPPAAAADTTLVQLGAPWTGATYGSYFAKATSEHFAGAAIGDVTGDGVLDVVTGGMDGWIRVFTTTNGALVGQAGTGNGAIQGTPALADVDADGVLDVTIGNLDGVVASYSFRNGTARNLFWRADRGRNGQGIFGTFGAPAVTDINGDGYLDIITSSWDHWVYAYSTRGGGGGSILPGWPQHLFDTSWSSPAVGDVDGDGSPDVVVGGDCDGAPGQPCTGSPGGFVWAFRSNGSLIWRHKVDGQVVWSSPALTDLDGDGVLDVVVGTGLNFAPPAGSVLLAVHGQTGRRMWTAPTAGRTMGSPAVGDVDGDGVAESFVLSEGGAVTAVRPTGAVMWRTCVDYSARCPADHSTHGSTVLADVDNDGVAEVVVMAEHHLRVLDARTGRIERTAEPSVVVAAPGSPASVAEVNGQTWIVQTGVQDVTGNGRGPGDRLVVQAWRTGTTLGSSPWPTFKGRSDRRSVHRPDMALPSAMVSSYVGALYQDFLGRRADDGGRSHWSRLITDGHYSRQSVAYAMANTDEWLGRVVTDFYRSTLRREPDAQGLAFWKDQLRRGMPVAEVASRFYESPEYYLRVGGTDRAWVSDLYRELMLREGEASGVDFWVDRTARFGRLSVARSFYDSPEKCERRVRALYGALLGRDADAAGLRTWPPLVRDRGDLVLSAFLASSHEYWLRAQDRRL